MYYNNQVRKGKVLDDLKTNESTKRKEKSKLKGFLHYLLSMKIIN